MLEPYERDGIWYAKGRVEFNGTPITDYIRRSTRSSTKAGAHDWIKDFEDRTIRAHLVGEEKVTTFADALMIYDAKGYDAGYLIKILPELGPLPLTEIYPNIVKALGPKLYPDASTDTWKRQVIAPVSAVINNAHQSGLCPPIKISAYSSVERIAQDKKRGKRSRREKRPGSWAWIDAFQAHASPHLAALAEFMFETGARISQAVALRPKDLDLQNNRVLLDASKGHDAQWVDISPEMTATLANLTPRRSYSRAAGRALEPRVFGYASRSGPKTAWARACREAGIEALSPHEAGRHGFFTELTVRQGVSEKDAAKAGRWSNSQLPSRVYAHAQEEQAAIRAKIRQGRVQPISAARKRKS